MAVNAHTSSAAAPRFIQRGTPRGNVSSTPIEMLRPLRTSHTSISGRRAVPRDDAERARPKRSDSLEDGDEPMIDVDRRSRPLVGELPRREVFTQIAHADSGYAHELAAAQVIVETSSAGAASQ
jgi:hypothetical protein